MPDRRLLLAALAVLTTTMFAAGCTHASPHADGTHSSRDADADSHDGADPDAGSGGEGQTIRNALEWYYGQREAPGDAIPSGALAAAKAHVAAMPAYAESTSGTLGPALAAAWTNVGSSPIDTSNPLYDAGGVARTAQHNVTGRVTALAAVPTDPQTLYAGGADGGVWKTIDGGASWKPIFDGEPTQAIGAITVSAATPTTVWVGTGEENFSGDSYYGAGVYRSTDGGATWRKRGGTTLDTATIGRIVLGHGTVFAATNHGLYRSVDAGLVWTQVLAPGGAADPTGNYVTDVVVLPGNAGTHVLAAVGAYRGDASNGLWLSTDSGATFTKVVPTGFAPQANIGRMSIAATGTTEYVVVQDAALLNANNATHDLNGVYKSTAGPAGPWTRVVTDSALADSNSAELSCYGLYPGAFAWYAQSITVDPTNTKHIVLGLEELYDSSDAGATWHSIGRYSDYCNTTLSATTHPDQHAGTFAVSGGVPTYFAGNDGGVWKQTGATLSNSNWVDLNTNLSLTQPYHVAVSAGTSPVIIAGAQDNGTVMGGVASQTWSEIHGGDGADVAIDPATPTTMYAEYPNLQLYRSTDSGAHWTAAFPPDNGSNAQFVAPFQLDATNSSHLVALGRHVWDDASGPSVSWTQVWDNGAGHLGTAMDVRGGVTYEGWCGCSNSATTFANGLATNQGGTWHAVAAAGLPNRFISDVLIDPANTAHVYVTLSGFSSHWVPSAGTGHVFESTDAGATFTDITSNLPDAPANSLVLSRGHLVVGTDVGVFKRTAKGTWGKFGTGLPLSSVLDLAVVPGTNTIVAATHGRGFWTLAG